MDRYARTGILNQDIESFCPPERFDALISVSTPEHLGFDASPRDFAKLGRVLHSLPSLVHDPDPRDALLGQQPDSRFAPADRRPASLREASFDGFGGTLGRVRCGGRPRTAI